MISSTRNHSKPSQKAINSARFFKKTPTDENSRNAVNYLERIVSLKNLPAPSPLSSTVLPVVRNASNKKAIIKKSMTNITAASNKALKTIDSMVTSTKNIDSKDGHQKSFKNLKLASMVQFPKILCKSISQTTMNKRSDQKTIKLLQKLGDKRFPSKKKSCSLSFNQIKISQFRLGKKLGSGRFGNVYLAEQKQTQLLYAIKVLNKQKIKQSKMQDQIIMQIKLQTFMNHPNLLKMYGYFHDNKNIYLILQYCSQCLFKDFRAKGRLQEQEVAYYGKQTISALKYMHNQYLMHRDIKPQNILVQFGVLKLSDFGWSTYSPMYKRQTFCGTVDYVPPQIVEGESYDERVDIWALGVLLYELASGKAPFQTKDENITYQKIVHSECEFPGHFSNELAGLCRKILDKKPTRRPDLQQIEQHAWFDKYKTTGRYISKPIWTAWNYL